MRKGRRIKEKETGKEDKKKEKKIGRGNGEE